MNALKWFFLVAVSACPTAFGAILNDPVLYGKVVSFDAEKVILDTVDAQVIVPRALLKAHLEENARIEVHLTEKQLKQLVVMKRKGAGSALTTPKPKRRAATSHPENETNSIR